MYCKASFLLVFLSIFLSVYLTTADFCPGHKIRCGHNQTCCDDKHGSYGCCPYHSATCCNDGLHCCPQDSVCDVAHGKCKSTIALQALVPSEDISVGETEVNNEISAHLFSFSGGKKTCADGKRTCPSQYTCCADQDGGYDCCPFKNGVCCSDSIHCCPQFYTCNVQSGACEKI